MNTKHTRILGAVLLLVPGLATSQQPGNVSGGGSGPLPPRAAPTRMYEDIEIMRRLLEGNLRSIYGIPARGEFAFWADTLQNPNSSSSQLNTPFDALARSYLQGASTMTDANKAALFRGSTTQTRDPHRNLFLPAAEGVHLPGYGVVYAMTLPPPSEPAKPEMPQPTRKPISDWDRTRKELRGEKVEADPPPEQRPPSVSGTILKVLADNGHNFADLKAEEVVTVAITFRSKWGQWSAQCTTCHAMPSGHGGVGMDMGAPSAGSLGLSGAPPGPGGDGLMLGGGGSAPQPAGGGGKGSASGPNQLGPSSRGGGGDADSGGGSAAGRDSLWDKIQDRVLLGDLHVKQGRLKEALDAYLPAADALEQYMNNTWNWDKDQVKAARELYGKLIQAHLAMGDNAAAKRVMDRIDKIPAAKNAWEVKVSQKPTSTQPGSSPVVLPGKMIVTATKRQLDQVASGKLSFEEFKKEATVQYLNFAGEEKPIQPGGKR
jgi:hypothetical protein